MILQLPVVIRQLGRMSFCSMFEAAFVACVTFLERVARRADVCLVVTFRCSDISLIDHTALQAFPVEGARAAGSATIAASFHLVICLDIQQSIVVGCYFRFNVAHATIRHFEASMVQDLIKWVIRGKVLFYQVEELPAYGRFYGQGKRWLEVYDLPSSAPFLSI